MKLAFLFPGSHPHDSIDLWVRALARFCPLTDIVLSRDIDDCIAHSPDVALCITEATCHPGKAIDSELVALVDKGIPCGVLWNNDVNGPTPGDYPSFCWTQRAFDNLKVAYRPTLRRQPVFPSLTTPAEEGKPLLVGTFGVIEPKKQIGPMWDWAKKHGVPFRAFGPDALVKDNGWYIADLKLRGCAVTIYPWMPRIEDLLFILKDVTHFLFVLPPTKDGTGGSSTSPRYATLFNRPVIVVDDEFTYAVDGFNVFPSLDRINPAYMNTFPTENFSLQDFLQDMKPPAYHWSPERYVNTLIEDTLKFWDAREGMICFD